MASQSRLDEIVEHLIVEEHIPGIALMVARRGEAVAAIGYGLSNVELAVPVSADSVFEIASVTKLFTAQAVLQLASRGQIDLDRTLRDYLPEYVPEAWADATVRHALSHLSGIPNYTDPPEYWHSTRLDISRDEILALVRDLPLMFDPGTNWSYSNTGYYLLGLLIESVSGRGYEDYLRENIFAPLGMSATRANNPYALVPGRVAGYTLRGDTLYNAEYYSPSGTYSAGVLLSTIADLLKWDAAPYTDAILPQRVIQEMWTPTRVPLPVEQRGGFTCCMGWFVFEDFWGEKRPWAGHNGGIKGFSSALVHFLDDDLTVGLLVNRDGIDRPDKLIARLLPALSDLG